MLRIIFIIIFGLCFTVVSYSVIRTLASAPNSRPFISAITLAILVVLVAFEWITADQASKGTNTAFFSLLPGIISWSTKTVLRFALVSFLSLAIASLMYWIGPHSLHQISILTDKAKFIRFSESGNSIPCDGWYSEEIWAPGSSWETTVSKVACSLDNQRFWKPELKGKVLECGEPLDPNLISNGIDISALTSRTTEGRRIREGVNRLRLHLINELPERDVDDTLLLATWNLREFDKKRRMSPITRISESYYYIAEIISHFDIIALQEIGSDITDLEKLLKILGDSYDVVYSLVNPKGRQRMAFIYDRRKVRLGPMVASVVVMSDEQLFRTPYAVTFDVFNQRITLCTVHIIFAGMDKKARERRVKEIKNLGEYLKTMSRHEPSWEGSLILLGDFNSPNPNSPEIEAIKSTGFYIDPDLLAMPSNIYRTKVYDQIAFLKGDKEKLKVGQVGTFEFFSDVFKDDEEINYRAEMGEKYLELEGDNSYLSNDARQRYYRNFWRPLQISDHLPKWMELRLISNN